MSPSDPTPTAPPAATEALVESTYAALRNSMCLDSAAKAIDAHCRALIDARLAGLRGRGGEACDFDHPHPEHPCGRRICRPGAWGGAGCAVHEGHDIGPDGYCVEGRPPPPASPPQPSPAAPPAEDADTRATALVTKFAEEFSAWEPAERRRDAFANLIAEELRADARKLAAALAERDELQRSIVQESMAQAERDVWAQRESDEIRAERDRYRERWERDHRRVREWENRSGDWQRKYDGEMTAHAETRTKLEASSDPRRERAWAERFKMLTQEADAARAEKEQLQRVADGVQMANDVLRRDYEAEKAVHADTRLAHEEVRKNWGYALECAKAYETERDTARAALAAKETELSEFRAAVLRVQEEDRTGNAAEQGRLRAALAAAEARVAKLEDDLTNHRAWFRSQGREMAAAEARHEAMRGALERIAALKGCSCSCATTPRIIAQEALDPDIEPTAAPASPKCFQCGIRVTAVTCGDYPECRPLPASKPAQRAEGERCLWCGSPQGKGGLEAHELKTGRAGPACERWPSRIPVTP